jgi:hypothetical protein
MLARDERLEFKIEPPLKKRALAHLAFSLQQTHQLACEREQAVQMIGQLKVKDDAQTILQETLKHGLLQGEQQVRFLHQSVQEYFVALALAELAKTERRMPTWQRVGQRLLRRNLAALARDDWWAESFVQLAGLTDDCLTDDPTRLVRELVTVKPWLAFWCSIEGKSVDYKTQALIEKKTVTPLMSSNVKQRRWVVRELARLENPRIIEYILIAITPSLRIRNYDEKGIEDLAVKALAQLGEPAVQPLLALFYKFAEFEHMRRVAMRALGQIWGLRDVVRLGDSKSKDTRRYAARALGVLGNNRAVEPLIAALKDYAWEGWMQPEPWGR